MSWIGEIGTGIVLFFTIIVANITGVFNASVEPSAQALATQEMSVVSTSTPSTTLTAKDLELGLSPNVPILGENGQPTLFSKNKDGVYCLGQVVGADSTTFVPIAGSRRFGKDKNNVFHCSGKISEADAASFRSIIGAEQSTREWVQNYAKDKNRVYVRKDVIEFADPGSFKLVTGQEKVDAQDNSYSFYMGKVIPAPSKSTEILDKNGKKTGFSTDGTILFFGGKTVELDPKTFQVIYNGDGTASQYVKDMHQVFFLKINPPGQDINVLQGADPGTFKVVLPNLNSQRYAVDKNNLYIGDKIVAGVDVGTFKEIKYPYFADKNRVYHEKYQSPDDPSPLKVVVGADPASFVTHVATVVRDLTNQFTMDKDHVFMGGSMLDGIDPNTFKEVNYPYHYQDKSAVYYIAWVGSPIIKKLENVSSTAKVGSLGTIAGEPERFLRINNHVYVDGNTIAGADASTFKEVDAPYYKDSRQVYYNIGEDEDFMIIAGADPNTFELMHISADCSFYKCTMDAKDKNHSYYKGVIVQ